MLVLPKSLKIKRAKTAEESLLKKSREWLAGDQRDPRIHVSDLMDPRLAYWQRVDPRELPDHLVTTFLVGKVLHSFVINAVDGIKESEAGLSSDEGSQFSKDLGIVYSMDMFIKGVPREIKTSRAYKEPSTHKDLEMYCEQLICYMAAENVLKGQLWLLLLNTKDAKLGRTAPLYRCYTVTVTQAEMNVFRKQIIIARKSIEFALEKKDHRSLPLCRGWKCSMKACDYWNQCKPEGRYGSNPPKGGWQEPEEMLICKPVGRANV